MAELQITIRFLDRRFHGRGDGGVPEWPPSPMRLFQALLAAAKSHWTEDLASAFRWLEAQPPPRIRAPQHETGSPCRTFVPNNNTDSPGQLRTDKLIQPTLMFTEPVLEYRWSVPPGDQAYAQRIANVTCGVRALGWGIDLAVGHGRVLTGQAGHNGPGVDWYPMQLGGDRSLRVPAPGSLASLEDAYRGSLARINPDGTLRDDPGRIVFHQMGYRAANTRPAVAFALQRVDDPEVGRAVRPHLIKCLVAMVRSAASSCEVVEALGADGQELVNRVVLGHPRDSPEPRLSILPLPSIGHPHSDGRIRRILLTESFGSNGRLVQILSNLLQGWPLQPSDPRDDLGICLVKIQDYDPVVRHYTGSKCTWSSATPVLLPGYDDRKQHRGDHCKRLARAEQLTCKALKQAGIEQSARITLSGVPLIPGTDHARATRPREKLSHYPRYHVRLDFDRPFAGPLSLGAGRHVGFGVMVSTN